MVSHIDADHITGIVDMLRDLVEKQADGQEARYGIRSLWHNSFAKLAGGCLLFLAFLMTVSTATPQTPSSVQRTTPMPVPPVAKMVRKEIVTHGDKRLDDYFWLREKTNAEVIAYLEAENAYGDAVDRKSTR